MLQMSVTLTEIEEKILNRGYGIGNDVLYKLCEDFPLEKICKNPDDTISEDKIKSWIVTSDNNKEYTMVNALAAQMWLIGRSYAAQLERRYYGVKIEWTNSGNGLDTYLDLLAKELWNNNYQKFNQIINSLNEKKYRFSGSDDETDKDILATVITAVLNLNRLLKKARFAVDFGGEDIENIKKILIQNMDKLRKRNKEDDAKNANKIKVLLTKSDEDILKSLKDNQWNMLSFSSKFLHFHFPEVVFILDSITKGHLKSSYSFTVNGKTEHSNIEITKYNKNTVKDYLTAEKFSNIIKNLIDDESSIKEERSISDEEYDYIKHCVNEYILAEEINNANPDIFKDKYIPRLIDTYVLIANSDFSDNPELLD